jgi:hypothetical protein
MNLSYFHRIVRVALLGSFGAVLILSGSALYYGGFSRVQSAIRGQVISVEPLKNQFPIMYEGQESEARFSLLNLSPTPCGNRSRPGA